MATAGMSKRRARFTAACGVLSRYVKEAAETTEARSPTMVALPLMPGADVSTTTSCASQSSKMTIFCGDRVLVLDDVPADRAAELLRLAASSAKPAKGSGRHGQVLPAVGNDLPVARKASLQRFMEMRKGRVAARATPYLRPDDDAVCHDRLTLAL